ncbi:MAG: ankyrin repeat domain-containing protein [Longimicrobiales bacterium]
MNTSKRTSARAGKRERAGTSTELREHVTPPPFSRRRSWPRAFTFLLLASALIGASRPDSPVADAAQQGDIETVRRLLQQGADVNAAQGDGMTALHWAAQNGNPDMMRILLYAGASVQATTRLGGYTPLHVASMHGLDDVVLLLLENGSDTDVMTSTGVTALHFAAQAGRPQAIQVLLTHGADVNAKDKYAGRTPLMFATASNRLDAIETLIRAGADVAATTEVVDYVKRSDADDVERERRDRVIAAANEPAETPPGRAGGGPRRAAQAQNAAARADTTRADTTRADTARADTARAANAQADTSQGRGRQAAADPQDPDRPTRRAGTAGTPDPDSPTRPDSARSGAAAPRALSYDAQVGRQGGLTALHYAARDGRMDGARRLLDAGADMNQVSAGDHSSPLLVAVINGNYDLAMALLESGADPNLASDDGAAPLFAVLNCEWALRTWYPQPTAYQQQKTTYLELMEALLDAGANPNARVTTHIWYAAYNAGRMGVDFAGATPFWRAAYATDVAAMRVLVKYGADPNISTMNLSERRRGGEQEDSADAKDPSGLPPVTVGGPAVHPLHAASGVGYGTSRVGQQHRHVPDGWLTAVQYLVEELGVDVNVRDHDGYSAVHNAAARGDNEMIRYLVEKGADVTVVSRRGQTTVDMANGPQQRVQPFPETIALLESMGATNNHKCQSCD